MSVVINIVLILVALLLIVVVLMQEGNRQGLGVIGGAAETFLGKNKAKSYEGKMLMITRIAAVVFVVLAIALTWMNARTNTVTYMVEDENGAQVEYFPYVAAYAQSNNMMVDMGLSENGYVYYEDLMEHSEPDAVRTAYKKGDTITVYPTPVKEGYIGTWLTEDGKTLPETMGSKDYTVYAKYEIGTYTVTVNDKDTELFTVTGEYGTAIEYPETVKLPEAQEGMRITWSQALPATIPGADTVIDVVYTEGGYVTYFDDEGNELYLYALDYANYIANYNAYAELMNLDETAQAEYIANYDAEADAAKIAANAQELYDVIYNAAVESGDMDTLRQFVENGAELTAFAVPAKEGMTGAWDIELPETMDGKNYKLTAVYTAIEAESEATETTETPAE